jgi:hypothetical protein
LNPWYIVEIALYTIPCDSISIVRNDFAGIIDFDVIFDTISVGKRLHLIGQHII